MRDARSIPQKETVALLNKCWMTHDAMWFFHCLQEFGIEATNKINKSAIKALAGIEIKRVTKAVDCPVPIENFDAFKAFFRAASTLVIPDFMNVSFDYSRENKITWAFAPDKCFAYAGVTQLGVIDQYECGVLYRIQCWLEALGIAHKFDPAIGTCHMHATGACAGAIDLFVSDEKERL